MKKKHSRKFLITSLTILVLGVGYLYFSNDIKANGIFHVAQGSSLASTTGDATAVTSTNSKITSDISFLSTLVSLKKIKIDTPFFANSLFRRLEDNSVKIESVVPGRNNPFAPIDESKIVSPVSVSKVVTNQATQVAETTVTLNGTINTTSGVTDTYFEYGATEALGSVTTMIKQQSRIGTFIKSVLGLTPKTTYFFKACAKINGASLCGDIASFTTK